MGVKIALKYAVYPRVCGGTRSRGCEGVKSGGLSPRVRGNPVRLLSC